MIKKNRTKILLILLLVNLTAIIFSPLIVKAQLSDTSLNGSDPSSYQCFGTDDQLLLMKTSVGTVPLVPDSLQGGTWYCTKDDPSYKNPKANYPTEAFLKPATIQTAEIIFVRVVYAIWAFAATLSFILIIGVGYEYLIRGGTSDQELVKLRKRLINFIIGFALVFLAIPILTTVFRLFNIDSSVACYNVRMPGFQFFYATLCTDPNGTAANKLIADPCGASAGAAVPGMLCNKNFIGNPPASCGANSFYVIEYQCQASTPNNGVWCYTEKINDGKNSKFNTCPTPLF